MEGITSAQAVKHSCMSRAWNAVAFFLLGVLILGIFATIQKIIMGGVALTPRGSIMPTIYGGITGFIIGEWYLRLKQNARQIRENAERLRALVDALPDIVVFKDGEGRWLDVNNVGMELLQFQGAEYYGQTDLELAEKKPILKDLFEYCHATDLEAWQRGVLTRCRVVSLPFGKRTMEYELVKVPLFWADGRRQGLVLVGRDVTEINQSERDLVQAYDSTLEGWAKAVEMRDRLTEDHTRRVVALTERLARLMGVPEADMVHIRRGAMLHDVGKIGIPDAILSKPAALTGDEMKVMVQHPEQAHNMLAHIGFLGPALDIPYCHHEHWDGCGYPRGLKGEEIPLSSRIFAVVDVWDALTSDRPYRAAWNEQDALNYIREQSGKYFDPNVVQTFLENFSTLMETTPSA
ncbi:MAG: HD domain-containing protein [Anaerolineaceae bacterium]|nr:MAG: HD domain-containing protein [Anaerolineaceae bacterium]